MALLSAPKAIGNTTKANPGAPKSALAGKDNGKERPQLKLKAGDPMDTLDDFEYGDGGPARAYKHLGIHILKIESIEEGDSEDSGDRYFSLNGEIVETDSEELKAGEKMRIGKTLSRKFPRYYFKHVAEITAAAYQSMGEALQPSDVKKAHSRQLTGGDFENPETGEQATAEAFDFAEANGGAGAFVKVIVKSEPKRDRSGKPTGEYENKVKVLPFVQDDQQ